MPETGTKSARRYATALRDKEVRSMYHALLKELGQLAPYMPKGYFYEKLKEKTGLSCRTLQGILNGRA